MKKIYTFLLLGTLAGMASCKKDSSTQPTPVENTGSKIAPEGFNFSTTKDVALNITLRTNNDQPLAGVVVSVYNPSNTESAIFKAVTDQNGNITSKVTVPTSATQLIIDPAYVGLIRNAVAAINGAATTAVIGGKTGFGGDVIGSASTTNATKISNSLKMAAATNVTLVYPSPYSTSNDAVVNTSTYPFSLGRPKYLESAGDVIDAALLKYVNSSLPENVALTKSHPEYLTSSATTVLKVTATSDVWITFVSEGAGFLNTLAYYTYKTGTTPTQESISDATVVFPNSSAVGSAGGLNSGDKVKLGRFSAGTSIGFVLLQNAWTGKGISTTGTKYFSNDALNPESSASLRRHSVLLYDEFHKLYLIGFEDLPRDTDSDNDFNDLVFYASSNPVTAISNDGVAPIDNGGDTDGDGVLDPLDAYPNDATKAYDSYYPSATTYSQVAFEDNWPNKGDYDMNDLVVNYRYKFVLNAKNEVVNMEGTFNAMAAGASFKNGFGIQLPVAASTVSSVSGQKIASNYIQFASNGVEAGQTKAVIIPFDNHDAVIKNADNSFFINTLNSKDKVTGTSATVTVNFASPVAQANLLPSAFNPFLISNLRRAYEVHLPGYAPTDKADTKLFGTRDDASKPASSKYYLSTENWPWAISYNTAIAYPIEEANITKAYLHFAEWAASGGLSFTDWYSNAATGYKNTALIYTK
ncbi:LruC domain-containing protein [Mucilaginibacter sp. UR6-1]|uniref:LruC domain-containing protein n=1 Tax=Mucilaginibacter sp. UR6-1 TaxID=1435643 RepID=UPI001E4679C6|nr:LruC domain-containing protein [Mucilaginibacter sp. UR6-1]MCC8410688.1 LruC domain-containing protein [Mucilaginibacter sp. UR6-1]